MNFDFLKDLRGLSAIYRSATDAEELANTKPDHSLFASRKSAESLAKFIYLAAHKEQAENMTFADILADYTVRNYLHNRSVMDAFHFIRKSGNNAVHGTEENTSEDAISVLHDLHYVAGETACRLGLLKSYPRFDENIGVFPEATYTEEDVSAKAQEMFLDYIAKQDEEQLYEQYISLSGRNLQEHDLHSTVYLHEQLIFHKKPRLDQTVAYLQKYLRELFRISAGRSCNDDYSAPPVYFKVKLSINNTLVEEVDFSHSQPLTKEKYAAFYQLIEKLVSAESFAIDLHCNGKLAEYYSFVNKQMVDIEECISYSEDDQVETNKVSKDAVWQGDGMFGELCKIKRRENFTYRQRIEYPDMGEIHFNKIENGQDSFVSMDRQDGILINEMEEDCSSAILDDTDLSLFPDSIYLYAKYDQAKHSSITTQLRAYVCQMLPKESLESLLEFWEEENDIEAILFGHQFIDKSLSEVERFLEGVNAILKPILSECELSSTGWWDATEGFAFAYIACDETGFHIVGLQY